MRPQITNFGRPHLRRWGEVTHSRGERLGGTDPTYQVLLDDDGDGLIDANRECGDRDVSCPIPLRFLEALPLGSPNGRPGSCLRDATALGRKR
jgi:hypothetical protein